MNNKNICHAKALKNEGKDLKDEGDVEEQE